MSTFDYLDNTGTWRRGFAAPGPLPAIRTALGAGLQRLAAGWHARRSSRQLYRLSERDLRDIGLSRSDLVACSPVAGHSFARPIRLDD